MSGSREDSVFYQLGRLASEAESRRRGYEDAESDPLTARWGKRLLYVAGGFLALGLFGFLPFDIPSTVALAFLIVGIAAVADGIEIVQAYEKRALTVFGAMQGLLDPGIHLVPPFVSRTYQFDLRTETLDVPRQEAITKDNSPVTADAVVYIRVMDPERAFLGVDHYRRATSLLAQTSLRAALGDMELDETLSRRAEINERIRRELDEPTDAWGVRVEAVEVREVMPSAEVTGAMEQQTAAERRRRAMILEAQGQRRSAVERAEGEKRSNVIRAQGQKQASILEAQGDAISTVLRAKAAESMGERAIIEKGMETLAEIGRSPSTTFVIPQELTSLLGRYGRQLSGSDVRSLESALESLEFDAETREMLGLDDIAELLDPESEPDRPEPAEVDVEIESVGEGVGSEREPEPESN